MSCSASWLPSFVVTTNFFTPCKRCSGQHSARDATLNFWDCETQEELCSVCVTEQPRDSVIQVRRSSYHDVVKVADLARLADISGIQSYVINGSKVLFLRRRPQPRPPKGAVGASLCTVCSRHLQDVSHYCSIQCKLDCDAGVKNVSLRSVETGTTDSGSSATRVGPETPSHALLLRQHHLIHTDGSDSDSGIESHLAKRRKGLPLRAPSQ